MLDGICAAFESEPMADETWEDYVEFDLLVAEAENRGFQW